MSEIIRGPWSERPAPSSPDLPPLRLVVDRYASKFNTYTVEQLECGHEYIPRRDFWYGQDSTAKRRRCQTCIGSGEE